MHSVGSRVGCGECGAGIVVVSWNEPADITCDASPLIPFSGVSAPTTPPPANGGGTQLGKRYVDESHGVELLVVRPGAGTLRAAGEPMQIKVPKPLPSSD